ncbi:unnamed protein product [Scytosiphon promiscuus]
MPDNLGGFGEHRNGFIRVESEDGDEERRPEDVEQVFMSREPTTVVVLPSGDVGGCYLRCGRWKVQVTPVAAIILLYMGVSMTITLLDKWLITDKGFGFDAPLTLISLTYLIMHLASLSIRARLRQKEAVDEGRGGIDRSPLLQQLSWRQWAWKVFPVAAASGLEVGTSTLGLQVMQVGLHTMVRSTVPIFVLLFSVGMGLQEFRCRLLLVVLLVSGGVALLCSGQKNDARHVFPIDGLLLTLLSGMLGGLKWTLSQVLLQGRGLYGRGAVTVGEHIHPFTLLHYMSLSSAATLVPFVLALELGTLRQIAASFNGQHGAQTAVLIVVVSLLALVLVLTEFTFVKKFSSLTMCIIGVVKELLLVFFSVAALDEQFSSRTGLGLFVTTFGVVLYKLVPKGPPPAQYRAGPRQGRQETKERSTTQMGLESEKPPSSNSAAVGGAANRHGESSNGNGNSDSRKIPELRPL